MCIYIYNYIYIYTSTINAWWFDISFVFHPGTFFPFFDGEAAERQWLAARLVVWRWESCDSKAQNHREPLTPDMDFWRLVLVEFLSWGPISMNGIMITMDSWREWLNHRLIIFFAPNLGDFKDDPSKMYSHRDLPNFIVPDLVEWDHLPDLARHLDGENRHPQFCQTRYEIL